MRNVLKFVCRSLNVIIYMNLIVIDGSCLMVKFKVLTMCISIIGSQLSSNFPADAEKLIKNI